MLVPWIYLPPVIGLADIWRLTSVQQQQLQQQAVACTTYLDVGVVVGGGSLFLCRRLASIFSFLLWLQLLSLLIGLLLGYYCSKKRGLSS
jgi:hypothetical protein